MQFVLLLALLVAEVIIQQHQLLQKSSFGSSNGTLPTTAQLNGGAYQQLPGSAGEAASKSHKHAQQNAQKREVFRAW